MRNLISRIIVVALLSVLPACHTTTSSVNDTELLAEYSSGNADDLLIVDCLLPGKIKRLGTAITYVTPRRAIKTTALTCRIRGGEYVAYDRSNYETALKVWLSKANEGDKAAQTYVGEIYDKGLGGKPDYALAAKWYKKAALQGYERAQINLGHLYEKGLGVEKDPVKALAWYRKASGLQDAIKLDPSSLDADANKRMQELSRQIELRKSEAESLRKQLDQTKWQLEETQKELKQKESEAETERLKLETEQQELEKKKMLTSSDYPKMANLEKQLNQRKDLLEKKDDEIIRMDKKIKYLESQTESYNIQLESLKKHQITLPGPSIVMINPPLVATRGIRIVKISSEFEMERVIEGKVIAPAGLLTFTVNDRNESVDKNGIFRVPIRTKHSNVPVKLIAVDKQEKHATIEFQLTSEDQKREKKALVPSKYFGNYYALIIGNKDYTNWPTLETPEKDAIDIAELMSTKYGFKTKVLINATRYQILEALNELRVELNENDNLLIYYAGHGHLEEQISRGYWIPVDAELDSNTRWISTIQLADILGIMSVKHVLIIADSCYSGALTRSSLARLETGLTDEARRHWIKVMTQKRSRTALTSGDLQPVIDRGGGEHSVFAKALLNVLQQNDTILEGITLHKEISGRVAFAASAVEVEQVPQYAPIRFAGHESGEFFFVPSTK